MIIKKLTLFIAAVFLLSGFSSLHAEKTVFRSVQLSAIVTKTPAPLITLTWKDDDTATKSYKVIRKFKDDDIWKVIAVLNKETKTYTDTNVIVGTGYEYGVEKTAFIDDNNQYDGFGYIYCGIELPPVETRGKLLLFVDKTVSPFLNYELQRFERDLIADGWKVIRYDVPRTEYFSPAAVENVKDKIRNEYIKDPNNLKATILFGRVAVPYSGTVAFDNHVEFPPYHTGAWPADVYYSDLTGVWTDSNAFSIAGLRIESHNIPLDGRFDQSAIPGKSVLQLGRIDLSNLPLFNNTEVERLQNYLNKDHNYRTGVLQCKTRGVINDNFDQLGVHVAATAWMNYSALMGPASIDSGSINTGFRLDEYLKTNDYLWAYGCYSGGFNSVQEIMYASDLATTNINAIFTQYLGSWFPDWDTGDNLLRASIASSPSILTSCANGMPFWYFHHMGLGETIGYSTMVTQNNQDLYQNIYDGGYRGIHIALMGDPTLTMFIVPPPKNFELNYVDFIDQQTSNIKFSWQKPANNILGYYIYRSNDDYQNFVKLNSTPVVDPTFIDVSAKPGKNIYMVRALKLEQTNSGSFYNLSSGAYFEVDTVTTSAEDPEHFLSLEITPNPASEETTISFNNDIPGYVSMTIYDLEGNKAFDLGNSYFNQGIQKVHWDLKDTEGNKLPAGVYILKMNIKDKSYIAKLVVIP